MLDIRSWPRLLVLIALAAVLVGCGDDDDDDNPTDPGGGDPATYATVSFVFDDSQNQDYTADDGLAWKGDFSLDPATGIITADDTGSGPFVMLHDDGAVADGGHEPAGETAGDHRWGAVVQVETPDADLTFTYGVISGSVDGSDGDWVPGNVMQTVTVDAGETGAVTAPALEVGGFQPPADHAQVTFAIDDTANQTYTEADGLAWKGSFSFDPATRILAYNGAWPGPYPMLHDDGPWTDGGHEPADAVAGDHVWSVAVWVDNSAAVTLEYGAIRGSVDGSDGAWIWVGANGTVTIPQGAAGPIAAPGLVLPELGTVDLRLTIDLSSDGANLAPAFQGADYADNATVKGSAWGWSEVALVDDGTAGDVTAGDGIFTFLLSEHAGPHDGLLDSGDQPEFVFVLGGVEYKVGGGCATEGVAAYLDDGSGWDNTDVQIAGNGNTYVAVP